ncbi:stemmadenine O-acetyltransferase-like [Henckelia pumila]|uniref:stemmadenine O-acetyltransferase-like n=1 Tax=Henckelia pumila TaxID=405737 RepID=UPI003C6DDB81
MMSLKIGSSVGSEGRSLGRVLYKNPSGEGFSKPVKRRGRGRPGRPLGATGKGDHKPRQHERTKLRFQRRRTILKTITGRFLIWIYHTVDLQYIILKNNYSTDCSQPGRFLLFTEVLKMKIDKICEEFIKPSTPTPLQLRDYNLSFIDERIPNTYVPLILYYSFHDKKNTATRSEMSRRLKNSLSDSLVHFYPLAGRMTDQASVHCNDEGILYIEAYVDGSVFALTECPENDILDKLVPFESNGTVSSCEEQLAIQVSFFKCGGFCIGTCISHRISDGFTLSSFIKSWAAISCGDQSNLMTPVYNAATVFPPRNTPDFKPNLRSLAVQPPVAKYVAKRFVFTASELDELKQEVVKNSSIVNPTWVEVLSGFLWYHCMVAKGVEEPRKSVAFHPVNLRGRIQLLSECSFGNLFQMTKAVATVDDQTAWIELVQKMRDAFGKIDTEYTAELLGEKGCHLAKENFMEMGRFLGSDEDIEVFRFSSYCLLAFDEADFGWGKPVWVSPGSTCIKNVITLLDSVKCGGGIEAWVVMAGTEMERLHQKLEFLGYLSSSSSSG